MDGINKTLVEYLKMSYSAGNRNTGKSNGLLEVNKHINNNNNTFMLSPIWIDVICVFDIELYIELQMAFSIQELQLMEIIEMTVFIMEDTMELDVQDNGHKVTNQYCLHQLQAYSLGERYVHRLQSDCKWGTQDIVSIRNKTQSDPDLLTEIPIQSDQVKDVFANERNMF